MPFGTNGKPVRPYTNSSEAIHNVMLQTKESYLRTNNKAETAKVSKLEFTKYVFEEVHRTLPTRGRTDISNNRPQRPI